MTIKIGICDDNPQQVQVLQFFLTQKQLKDLAVVHATDPNEFLIKLKADKPHLVFLDIDMPGMNGMQLFEQIKAMYSEVLVVFITAHEQYALEAFRLRAFHYLLKPITQMTFERVLNEALLRIKQDNASKPDNVFSVQTKGEMIRLRYNEIRYFEKIGHKIVANTESRSFTYYDNFANLLHSLQDGDFVQCHQGYIVNADKIRSYRDKTLFLDGNIELPVSRSYAEKVKETLARRLFASKEET